MSVKNGKDYLYLVWKSTTKHKRYIVGQLTKNGKYEFCYRDDLQEAINAGFKPLVAFPDLSQTYYSDTLFQGFASRLPDKKRKDINKILDRYGLKDYDEYELLKRSHAILPIDTFEFVDPVFNANEPFVREFFISGLRHYMSCFGEDCKKKEAITRGDELLLEIDEGNVEDINAVKVLTKENCHIGYIPRYYSETVKEIIKAGRKISCNVTMVNAERNCDECIKMQLKVE